MCTFGKRLTLTLSSWQENKQPTVIYRILKLINLSIKTKIDLEDILGYTLHKLGAKKKKKNKIQIKRLQNLEMMHHNYIQ